MLAIVEGDRNLLYAEPGAQGAVGQLDLECVTGGAQALQVDGLQHGGREALEAASQVPHLEPKHPPCVPAAAPAREPAWDAPRRDPAALDIARTERKVGIPVAYGRQQARQVARVV